MGTSILRQLKIDLQDLKDALSEQEGVVANAQATILRLEGAITYITKFTEHLDEQKAKKKKGGKEDASPSG